MRQIKSGETARAREAGIRWRALVDGRLIARAASILEAASVDWRRAPRMVERGLREAGKLPSPERRLLAEAVHGAIRMRRRLAFLAGTDDPRAQLLVWWAATWPRDEAAPATAPPLDPAVADALVRAGVDVARVADPERALAAIADPVERLGTSLSYPDWIVARVLAAYGDAPGTALLAAMNRRAPLAARVNRLKTDRDALAARLAEEGVPTRPARLARDGLLLDTHVNVYSLAAFRDGSFELQDEGSQLIAELVAPPPRSVAVDACAGAGGKTLALGAALENRGRVVALDVAEWKLAELRTRVRRAGLSNVEARRVAPGEAPALPPAERVLVDAPCSGLGVVRRNPETRWRLEPSDLDELPKKQGALLDTYAALVRPGGRLVYATCAILPDENDAVVDAFLGRHPEFVEVAAREILGRERALAVGDGVRLRVLPHLHDTDGFFAATLRRKA